MLPTIMDSAKTKTLKREKTSTKSEVGSCLKDARCRVQVGESVIDISHLSNGVDLKEDAPESEDMGIFPGSLEAEAKLVKKNRMKAHMEESISEEGRKKIAALIEDVGQLSDVEKLFLYLQLPTGTPVETDPLKQKCPGNPLGKKADAEVAQTYTWIQSHLEEDSEVSLPKQEVYEEYRGFFEKNKIEPLCAADFGKVMKHVFPSVRPRRLGTRGNSRYCYSGLRKKCEMRSPSLPDLLLSSDDLLAKDRSRDGGEAEEEDLSQASWHLIREWAEKLLSRKFATVRDLARHLVDSMFVDSRSVAAFTLLSAKTNGIGEKGTQGSAASRNPGKRREAQQQLQRKLQEKKRLSDQKRKLAEQRSQALQACTSEGRQYSKKAPHQKPCSPSLGPTQDTMDPCRRVKEEPVDTKLQTPAGNNIIFVPTVQSPQLADGVAPSGGCKYKKIQPKPTCRGTAVVLRFSSSRDTSLAPAEGMPTSQSPVVVCTDGANEPAVLSQAALQVEGGGESKLVPEASVATMKRHSEDGEGLLCKRRHTEAASQKGSLACLDKQLKGVKEEMCVVHLEKEALNDYYGNSDSSLMMGKEDFAGSTTNVELSVAGDLNRVQSMESNTAKLSQLRMLLERNLPSSQQRKDATTLDSVKQMALINGEVSAAVLLGQLDSVKNGSALQQVSLPQNHSVSMSTVHWKGSPWTNIAKSTGLLQNDGICFAGLEGLSKMKEAGTDMPSNVCDTNMPVSLDQTLSVPAPVPCSPNTRGRFFTPISPQTTPLPEGMAILPALSSPILPSTTDMVSVAVGTSSQPPSATSSPFVSPRSTPVPWTRSRHSSGHSTYSGTPRQTPFQAVDSGVSSISGSPFVSPQSTPVTSVRSRHCSSYNPSKAFTNGYNGALPGRARHSSGPGGPCHLVSPRSAPLSPMVGESSTQTYGFSFPSLGETPTLLRSRHNSASSAAPPSPQSAPLSPLVTCQQMVNTPMTDPAPSLNECTLPSDTDSGLGQQPVSPEWMSLATPKDSFGGHQEASSTLWAQGASSNSNRQRHASGPVLNQRMSLTDPFSHEIQEYLKNATLGGSTGPLSNRSRSVPVHQMLMMQEEMDSFGNPAEDSFSKSYPATPNVTQCFSFPTVGASQQPSDALTYTGQDAQADDVFLAVTSEWNSSLENESAMKFGEGDDFDAELQSTLEDLKDCDEFSKFAKELDFTAENEDDEMA